jgi:predicted metal-dependent peptidase
MTQVEQEMKQALFKLGFWWPFFGLAAGGAKVKEGTGTVCKTAYVTADCVIHADPDYWSKLTDTQKVGLMGHELSHWLFGHHERRGGREHKLFNIATDIVIDTTLGDSDPKLDVPDSLMDLQYKGWSAERVYAHLLDQQPEQRPEQSNRPGIQPADGEGDDKVDPELLAAKAREVLIQSVAVAKSFGDGSNDELINLATTPAARVRWAAILRRGMSMALANHGYDEQTWARRGRRSDPDGAYYAGFTATRASVAVAIDTSGSMSDDALAQCVAECKAAVKHSGVPMYLAVHDSKLQWSGWIKPGRESEIATRLTGRGGTDAHPAFDAIRNNKARHDVFVYLTDGGLYCGWPKWPANCRKRFVALMETWGEVEVPEGARVFHVEI